MQKPSVGRKIWFSIVVNPQVIRQIWVHESFQQISRDMGSLMLLIKVNQLHKWWFLQPVCNWKCIKYLRESFNASELIFTGTRAGMCISQGALCVPRAKIRHERLFLSQRSIWLANPSHLPVPPKKETHKLDLPHFRDEVFVLGPRPLFRQTGVKSLLSKIKFSVFSAN